MSKDRKYLLALPLVAAAFMVIGLWTGFYFSKGGENSAAREKLDEVFSIIEDNYVEPVSYDSLVELALPELIANLDPHSSYFAKSEREAANRDLEGSFYGIGIQFQMLDDTLNVIEVIAGAAADEAGMQPGDRIIEIGRAHV